MQAFQVRKKVFVDEQGNSEDLELDGCDCKALHMVVHYGIAKIERMAVLKNFR